MISRNPSWTCTKVLSLLWKIISSLWFYFYLSNFLGALQFQKFQHVWRMVKEKISAKVQPFLLILNKLQASNTFEGCFYTFLKMERYSSKRFSFTEKNARKTWQRNLKKFFIGYRKHQRLFAKNLDSFLNRQDRQKKEAANKWQLLFLYIN